MVFAHGIGGARDLPIPVEYFLAGASAALAISFIVLTVAWRSPRFDASAGGIALPAGFARVVDGAVFAWVLRALGLLFFLYVGWAAVAGPDLVVNPFFGVVYVWLWVGLVPMSLLFGPFFRAVSPVRTVHLLLSRAMRTDPERGVVRLPLADAAEGLAENYEGTAAFLGREWRSVPPVEGAALRGRIGRVFDAVGAVGTGWVNSLDVDENIMLWKATSKLSSANGSDAALPVWMSAPGRRRPASSARASTRSMPASAVRSAPQASKRASQ